MTQPQATLVLEGPGGDARALMRAHRDAGVMCVDMRTNAAQAPLDGCVIADLAGLSSALERAQGRVIVCLGGDADPAHTIARMERAPNIVGLRVWVVCDAQRTWDGWLGEGADAAPQRARIAMHQLEACDAVVWSGARDAGDEDSLEALLGVINPRAEAMCVEDALAWGDWDAREHPRRAVLEARPGRQSATLAGSRGVEFWQYEVSRPFHPERVHEAIRSGALRGIVRARGLVWLATRMERSGVWDQVGASVRVSPGRAWYAAHPQAVWGQLRGSMMAAMAAWREPHGDRRQALACVTAPGARADVQAALDACALSDEEMEGSGVAWAEYHDPLPSW